MDCKSIDQFTSPTRKLLRFFRSSRDRWKGKCIELRRQHKKLQNQCRAVEKSRQTWRQRAQHAEQQLAELQVELKKTSPL